MAERTLRERCIEAGAEALTKRFLPGVHWPTDRDFVTAVIRTDSAAALDAVLGVLTEHAAEWISDVGAMEWETWSEQAIVLGLLAVLGGDE